MTASKDRLELCTAAPLCDNMSRFSAEHSGLCPSCWHEHAVDYADYLDTLMPSTDEKERL